MNTAIKSVEAQTELSEGMYGRILPLTFLSVVAAEGHRLPPPEH